MTTIELRQKLIEQINQLSLQKLLFLEQLVQSLDIYFPDASEPELSGASKGWQPSFFEEVIGSWEGEKLAREDQSDNYYNITYYKSSY
ncbi:hypothetical protein [Parathermosynechococcus lividus]